LYLAVFFFLAVTVTSFVVSLGASAVVRGRNDAFARRAARVSRVAGWVTSLACLAYLTLWWRNANAGFGWSAPVWTAFALLVAVAISLLLGHAQRITTLAVLASAAGPAASLPPVGARSWRVVLGGGALAFAGAAALLLVTAPRALADDKPALTVVSTGKRVRVIAIDGYDMSSSPEASAGLAALNRGRHVALTANDLSDPARAWTTIATGQPPDIHGVHEIETRRVAGLTGILSPRGGQVGRAVQAATDAVRLTRPSIASREERRVKTIWEVASDAGLRTAAVNWWATWPAPPDSGIVITDRAAVRLEQGGSLDAEIAPASLYPELKRLWPGIREKAHEAAARQFSQLADPQVAQILVRSAELDGSLIGLFLALPGPARDLDLIYLPGLDIAQHALLSTAGGPAPTPSVVAARLAALRSYYTFLDQALVPLVPPNEPSLMVMRILAPGRVNGPAEGNVALTNAAEASDMVERAEPVDLAPTIALALGLPLSSELPGKPRTVLFTSEFVERYPGRYVPTYGRPFTRPAREGKPLDQEMIDRLRSLGYIK